MSTQTDIRDTYLARYSLYVCLIGVGGESLEGAKNGCLPKETWSGLTRRAKENRA